jgi:Protein of unknown function (DUF3034)
MLKSFIASAIMAQACIASAGDGKLLGTGGLLSIEGSAGGGLTPWAVLAGYGEKSQVGVSAAYAQTTVDDYRLRTAALAVGISNRLELSVGEQRFDFSGSNIQLSQRIYGAKVRVFGDLIYDSAPQVSVGWQHKSNTSVNTLRTLGITRTSGDDYFLSVGKLWLDGPFGRNFLLNGTVRYTAAQQTGLLGFANAREWQLEAAAALLLNRQWAIGSEYRSKPDAIPGLREDDWKDVFLAYFPNKQLSIALAYVSLGDIGGKTNQNGAYLTVQGLF